MRGMQPVLRDVYDDPMFLMQMATKSYLRCMQALSQAEEGDASTHKGPGFPLFVLLEDGEPVRRDQRELATMLGVTPPTMTAALKRLERLGYIQKHEDPRDLRRKLIGLTEEGMDFIRRRQRCNRRLAAETMRDMDAEEVTVFTDQLKKMNRNLSEIEKNLGVSSESCEREER